jgi:antitoxin (DNA-binding transcriptional repressor) of toxin-antitoxin stability system
MRTTKKIGVRELVQGGLTRAIEAAQGSNLVITKHGRPVAILIGVATETEIGEAVELATQRVAEMLTTEEG